VLCPLVRGQEPLDARTDGGISEAAIVEAGRPLRQRQVEAGVKDLLLTLEE
jgi:hypothetical protein